MPDPFRTYVERIDTRLIELEEREQILAREVTRQRVLLESMADTLLEIETKLPYRLPYRTFRAA